MNGDAANAAGDNAARPRPAGSKFTFPSGSRPLDGYTIKRGVGIGGFGEVYFATSDAGKEVALKRIQRNLDIELRGVRQCLNLKHQNLVALFDIRYDEQEQAWVVMEYVPGASLKDIIDQHPAGLPIEDVHRWFRGLAAGTAYLHDHGIVHRDLKPGNIFDDDGIVKIGDYGLSKFISCSRRSGQTESVGTFHYMAPEIGKGNYGREIDIYALGIILYEMLTGNVPFDGESTQEIIMKHLTADPDVSKLAQPYRYVISRALLKDPQKRFSSVYEMLDALGLASPSEISTTPRTVRPNAGGEPEVPPIAAPAPTPLFIGEDEDMVFGPVKVSGIHSESAAAPVSHPSSPSHGFMSTARAPLPTGESAFAPVLPVAAIPAAAAAESISPSGGSAFWTALDLENEPIYKGISNAVKGLTDWLSAPHLNLGLRIVVIIALVAALSSATAAMPALMLLFVGYAIYLGIRFALNYGQPKPSQRTRFSRPSNELPTSHGLFMSSSGAAMENDIAIPPVVASPPRQRSYVLPAEPAPTPSKAVTAVAAPDSVRRERKAMRLNSSLFCALAAIGLSLAAIAALQNRVPEMGGELQLGVFTAWLSVVCVGAVWGVLQVNRLFDPQKASLLRRIVMGALGAGIGCAALAMQQFLKIDELPVDAKLPALTHRLPPEFSMVAFFFTLFALMRWWRLADPMRVIRWDIGATLLMVVVGGLLGYLLRFPQPWGPIVAGVIAASLQIGASRFSAQRRISMSPFAVDRA